MSGQALAIGTESAQTGHLFARIVIGEGGGTTPRPYRVGAETTPAGSPMVSGGSA
jgi:hypothetical protein